MSRRLLRITNWERLAIQAQFDPANLAGLCFVSLRQLERHFLREFHKTPRAWLRELQCKMARELIAQGYSNKAAAAELKFTSTTQFCRQFKKIFGVSPQTFAPRPKNS